MTERREDNTRKQKKLYIAMISLHGLVRGTNIELGRDADTGGQIKYVIDLAKSVSQLPQVGRVDLITRQIIDKKVDPEYAELFEQLDEHAFLIRIPCGPKRYLRKEKLWPYLDEFGDNILRHFRKVGRVPDAIHGHYADAGKVGAMVAGVLGVPLVFTGHSLGRSKKNRLMEQGKTEESLESKYNISTRIEAEEIALDSAQLVITSTRQEHQEQYAVYANYKKTLTRVIAPGVDLEDFKPPKRFASKPPIFNQIKRFLDEPEKPMILALSRPDERKNVAALLEAYASNEQLQQIANLVLVLGNRKRILELDKGGSKVLGRLLFAIDDHDLWGKVAFPKHHAAEEVSEIYRLATSTKGVFVNPALTEPFGLTLIEAAASGLPVVATKDGGPAEILEKCKNGLLIDPLNTESIAGNLLEALTNKKRWETWSKNGIRNSSKYYTWEGHAKTYLSAVKGVLKKFDKKTFRQLTRSRLPTLERLLITDLDGTLFGDGSSLQRLINVIKQTQGKVGLGIATGRNLQSAMKALKSWGVETPDILITAVGSEIYYGMQAVQDHTYRNHINYRWEPDRVRQVLAELPGLRDQPASEQREHKISYYLDPENSPTREQVVRLMRKNQIAVQVIHSHGKYLDILPLRASKGHAIRYVALKWGIPLDNILVAGDSGNDEEMLRINSLGVVVGNHSEELNDLRDSPNVYFAEAKFAAGILEGAQHYHFFN